MPSPRKARRSPTPAMTSSRSSVCHLVPLVQHHDGRAPRHADALGQPLVLVGGTHRGVDDEQGDVGPLQRPERPQRRVLLGAAVGLGRAAQPGGVDEADRPLGGVHHRVDGVAGRPRHVVHDRALLTEQPVEEGRLADIGPPDDGHPGRGGIRLGAARSAAGPVAPGRGGQRGRPPSRRRRHHRRCTGLGSGSRETTSSSRSPVPRPCSALTG